MYILSTVWKKKELKKWGYLYNHFLYVHAFQKVKAFDIEFSLWTRSYIHLTFRFERNIAAILKKRTFISHFDSPLLITFWQGLFPWKMWLLMHGPKGKSKPRIFHENFIINCPKIHTSENLEIQILLFPVTI